MTNVTIRKEWYDDLLGRVLMINPYFYTENGVSKVEVDVFEPHFDMVSKELGWMI